jgi:hypothetical protein
MRFLSGKGHKVGPRVRLKEKCVAQPIDSNPTNLKRNKQVAHLSEMIYRYEQPGGCA